ncbi:ATP phosphoribosyltransferase [Methylorubrum populi]|uniref:ATP phosphoribosyltransferase n=1 Tax=Methylorubrum populi TaxID=223967 RepID=A0A160PDW1_9HYPH|nr:hypothetical protein [Methylorubrum populi]BAU90696.1 ATP phosphoribosyltransferase [Methylorubrum populi]
MATKDDERAARLKAALRDNLRRRKAQARSRADEAPGSAADTGPDASLVAGSEPAPKRQPAGKG